MIGGLLVMMIITKKTMVLIKPTNLFAAPHCNVDTGMIYNVLPKTGVIYCVRGS